MPSAKAFSPARLRAASLALCVGLLLAACGGGGGGGSPSTGANTGGGGTGTGGTGGTVPVTDSNVLPLVVDSGPAGISGRVANLPYVTITVCPPGSTSNCRTIDHVLVDTGSAGLRLMASALGSAATAALPLQANGAGAPYAQCASFISGYTWGSVRSADVTLGGLVAPALPIQVIADPAYPTVPQACADRGTSQNNVSDLGANGILGISQFAQDCGDACVTRAIAAAYYSCPSAASCTATAVPLAQQVAQPISRLASDNNGSTIRFPAVAPGGQATVAGQLLLGIGTRANNAVGSAVAYGLNRNTGYLSSAYNGRTYSQTAFDSGSNFNFFTDASLPVCSNISTGRFYCPATTQTLSATINGTNAASTTVSFRVANASAQFSSASNIAVLPDVAADIGVANTFLWGLPFFYGRTVFTSLVGASTPLGTGPFVAF